MKNKALILRRLKATVEKLKELPNKKFKYDKLVSEFDEKNNCGTVCCVVGWYPDWFPKSKFSYIYDDFNKRWYVVSENETIPKMLSKYHRLNEEVIMALFYGYGLDVDNKTILKNIPSDLMESVSKLQAIKRFQKIISLIEVNKLNDKSMLNQNIQKWQLQENI